MRADAAPPRWVLAAAVVGVVACLALFVCIAEDVLDGGGFISHDQAVLDWMVKVRTTGSVQVARVVSVLGGVVGLSVLSVLTGVLLVVRGWRWVLAVAPTAALALAGAAAALGKALFGRPRPPVHVHETTVGLAAFPSAHATDAAACLLTVAGVLALTLVTRRWPRVALLAAAAFLAGVVGVSRLVLGVHWLSDVVAGWALGTAVALVAVTASWWGASRLSAPSGP